MSPLGHFAIGFYSKKYAGKLNVILLLFASFFIDVVYFISNALGGEIDAQLTYSHSFLAASLFSCMFYFFARLISKNYQLSYVLAIVVFSHWLLDFIVWNNLSWLPRSTQNIGLGFYNKIGIDTENVKFNTAAIFTTILESSMLITGVVVYLRACKKSKKV